MDQKSSLRFGCLLHVTILIVVPLQNKNNLQLAINAIGDSLYLLGDYLGLICDYLGLFGNCLGLFGH